METAARSWVVGELVTGRLSLAAIKDGLPATRALADTGEARPPVTAALDVLMARIFDDLPDDKLMDLPEPVWELLTYLVDAGG
jgi:hypothetical protein